jgi:hypothetical protein
MAEGRYIGGNRHQAKKRPPHMVGERAYTGRFFRAEAESRRREQGTRATQGSPPFPSSAPAPTGNGAPRPAQKKPTCVSRGPEEFGKGHILCLVVRGDLIIYGKRLY